jgi:Protein of unknown function (DUF551)
MEEVMKWISVNDRLPEVPDQVNDLSYQHSGDVLVIDALHRQWVANYYIGPSHGNREWWCVKNDNENCCTCVNPDFSKIKVTHWMSLPESPEDWEKKKCKSECYHPGCKYCY